MRSPFDPAILPLVGENLSLDLANTMEWRGTARERDWIATYADFVMWCLHAGALDPATARRLRTQARAHPGAARAVVGRVQRLREAVYAVGSALAQRRRPSRPAIAAFNDEIFPLVGRTGLNVALTPEWSGPPDALERPLWPLAWAAFELFGGGRTDRIRQCANTECRWLFVDRSKNRSRRWCDMGGCGNLEKARRYRARRR